MNTIYRCLWYCLTPLVVLIMPVSSFAGADFTATVQGAWNTQNFHPVISAGVLFKSSKLPVTYYEFGIAGLPRFSYSTADKNDLLQSSEKPFCFYGPYCGYYVAMVPLFRPGVILGTVIEQKAVYSGDSKTPYEIKDPKLGYYAGLSIHVLFMTFQVTNYGIGGGINLNL